MSSIVSLRRQIIKTMGEGVEKILKEIAGVHMKPLSKAGLEAFAADMQMAKCNALTELVTKAETVIAHVDTTSTSWKIDQKDLVPKYPELKEQTASVFKAVVSAFAGKCIVSRAAKKGLTSAKTQAERAIEFAATNGVTLDDFMLEQLQAIKDSKGAMADDE